VARALQSRAHAARQVRRSENQYRTQEASRMARGVPNIGTNRTSRSNQNPRTPPNRRASFTATVESDDRARRETPLLQRRCALERCVKIFPKRKLARRVESLLKFLIPLWNVSRSDAGGSMAEHFAERVRPGKRSAQGRDRSGSVSRQSQWEDRRGSARLGFLTYARAPRYGEARR
jgi:hypothetical protein